MPSSGFGVSRHGTRIHKLRPSTAISTGITYDVQFPGLVPFFEEYDAMVEANHTTATWRELDNWEKAEAVARYRIRRHIAGHESEAQYMEAKRKK